MLLRGFHSNTIIVILIMFLLFNSESNSINRNNLNRRKRYIVFPEGSSFSVALCMTAHTLTADSIFTEGLNWGISYDLPNESKLDVNPLYKIREEKTKLDTNYKDNIYRYPMYNIYKNNNTNDNYYYIDLNNERKYQVIPEIKKYYKANKLYVQRRYHRDLYNKIEVILNAMGFDGQKCILRALCEASQRLMPKGNSLIEEMMRIVFTLPLKKVFSFEPEEHHMYTDAHKVGYKDGNCAVMFSECSFSLIDMAVGKYNAPDIGNSYFPYNNPHISERYTRIWDTSRNDALPPNIRYTMK